MISQLALGTSDILSAFDVGDDGKFVYVATHNCISMFNIHDFTGIPRHTIYYEQPKPISKMLVQKSGSLLGTLRNNVVALWDPNNSLRPLINILQSNTVALSDFQWNPNDSHMIFTAFSTSAQSGNTGGALVWDIRQSTKPAQTIVSQGRNCSKIDLYSSTNSSSDFLATLMDFKQVCISDLRMVSAQVDDAVSRSQVISTQDPTRDLKDINFFTSDRTLRRSTERSSSGKGLCPDILLSYEDGAMELWKVDLSAGCSLQGFTVSCKPRTRSELSAVAERPGEEAEEDIILNLPTPLSAGAVQYREEMATAHGGHQSDDNRTRRHVIHLHSFHHSDATSVDADETPSGSNSLLLYSKNQADSIVGLKWTPNHNNVSALIGIDISFHD